MLARPFHRSALSTNPNVAGRCTGITGGGGTPAGASRARSASRARWSSPLATASRTRSPTSSRGPARGVVGRRRAGDDDEGLPRERTRGAGARDVSVDRIGDEMCGCMHDVTMRVDRGGGVWRCRTRRGGVGLVVAGRGTRKTRKTRGTRGGSRSDGFVMTTTMMMIDDDESIASDEAWVDSWVGAIRTRRRRRRRRRDEKSRNARRGTCVRPR